MNDRSATATIKGYCYQFDKTIVELLRANETDTVTVEHIEDVNLTGDQEIVATQCKYVPASNLTDSVIREPVSRMLDDFIERAGGALPIRYRLYAHFGGSPVVPAERTVAWVKNVLTYNRQGKRVRHHEERGISDGTLQDFLDHFTIELGPDFDEQQKSALRLLAARFRCTGMEGDHLYYNNALRIVAHLSIQPDPLARTICKQDFCNKINTKTPLFNLWYRQLRGSSEYARFIRGRIKNDLLLHPQKDIAVFLDAAYIGDSSGHGAASLIHNLALQYYPLGTVFHNVKPLTVLIDATASTVIAIKKHLLHERVHFNDGYEHLAFSAFHFSQPPLIRRKVVGRRATDSVDMSSYQIRLLSVNTFLAGASSVFEPNVVLFFSDQDPSHYFPLPGPVILPITCACLEDIAAVLYKK
ncbi:MAG: hypothetical protein ACRYFS_19770 [Janthinobacterium lividum]